MTPALIAIILLGVLLVIGVPIGFSMLIAGYCGFVLLLGWGTATGTVSSIFYSRIASYELSVVPVFIMMGHLAFTSGMVSKAFIAAHAWLGHIRGGLALAVISAGALFGAACGSSMGSAVTLSKMAIPEMRKYGYNDGFSGACVASAGLLAMTIPPSMMLVVYAVYVGASVGDQLIAGFLPGVLTASIYMIGTYLLVLWKPSLAPHLTAAPLPLGERFKRLSGVWAVAVVFLSVMGAIYFGVATPTEAASVGVFVVIILVLKEVGKGTGKAIIEAGVETCLSTAFMLILVGGASLFSIFLARVGFINFINETIATLNWPNLAIIAIILVLYIIAGMFVDGLSTMLMMLPMTFPIIMAMGYDKIWWGVVNVLMIEIGMLTPPVGMNVFALVGVVPGLETEAVFRNVIFYVIFTLVVVGLIIAFPDIALILPRLASSN